LAEIAARQAFFWTNTSPQHRWMNQNWWRELEEWEASVVKARGRAIGFSGPVLRPDDPDHGQDVETVGRLQAKRTFRLPQAYWKVVVAPIRKRGFGVAGFLIEQKMVELRGPGSAKDALQCRLSLVRIEDIVGIEFPKVLHEFGELPDGIAASQHGSRRP
jgi:DNA/RNA endonuclease G (NUC1)